MNRNRKLTIFGKFIFVLLITIFIFSLRFLLKKTNDEIVSASYNDLNVEVKEDFISIVDTSESDSNIVKKYFSNGMDLKYFENILNQKDNYIIPLLKYTEVNYNFEKKMHYSELEEIYVNFANSDIANVDIIGKSVDNRNIYGIEIGKGEKVLYIDANIHAAEVANTLIITKFLIEIINLYESNDKEIVNILNNITIACIPCINPDGYEVYNFGVDSLRNKDLWWYVNKNKINFNTFKSNANGVDINRNFPSQNGGLYYNSKKLLNSVSLSKTTVVSRYYAGSMLGSEPETQACMYFMLKHYKNIYAYLNMHSQGRVLYSGKPNLSDDFNDISQKLSKSISEITGYKAYGLSNEEVGEGNDGTASDFMAELANGFVFSSLTGRLSTDRYIDNSSTLMYDFSVVTVETIKSYTDDPKVFKDEYYNHGIRKMLFSMLEYNN